MAWEQYAQSRDGWVSGWGRRQDTQDDDDDDEMEEDAVVAEMGEGEADLVASTDGPVPEDGEEEEVWERED